MTLARLVETSVLLALLAAGGGGCATSPKDKLKSEFEAMRKETDPRRLELQGDALAGIGDATRAEQYYAAALRAGGSARTLTRKLVTACAADGRYQLALVYADDYLGRNPNDLEVRYAAATVRAATGEGQRARVDLERVLAAKPDLADAHFALAHVLEEEHQLLGADEHFRAYLKLEPTGPRADVARSKLLKQVPPPRGTP